MFERRQILGFAGTAAVAAFGLRPLVACSKAPPAADSLVPAQFGAAGDGRTDDTAALQRALDAAIAQGKLLDMDRGTYRVSGSIHGRGQVRIVNSGGAVIEAVAGEYRGGGVLVLSGEASTVGGLLRRAEKGSARIALAKASSFRSGDFGAIYDPAARSFSRFRPYYRSGEFFGVERAEPEVVHLQRALQATYDPRSIQISRINPVSGSIRDVEIRASGAPESLIVIDYGRGFLVENVRLRQAGYSAILVSRSVDCQVKNAEIANTGNGGDDYGIVIANSQDCKVDGGSIYARRHAVTIGGGDRINSVPCRRVAVENATLRNDPAAQVACADIHGNSDGCGYRKCTVFGGYSPQGRSSYLRDSTVHAMSSGIAVYAAELIGGEHVIEGNTFYFEADPSRISRGAIDFGGNSDAITAATVEDLSILVLDNTFHSQSFSGNTMAVYARNAGTDREINVRFVGNDLQVNRLAAAVRVRLAAGVAKSRFIEVEANSGTLRNLRKVYPDEGYAPSAG